MMHPDEIRSNLAKRLGRRSIPDYVWTILQFDRAFIDDAGIEPESFDRLAAQTEAILKLRATGGTKVRENTSELYAVHQISDPIPDARTAALGAFLAAEVAADKRVCSFRQEVLGGGLLSADELEAMVESPAARMFPRMEFIKRESFAGRHRAKLLRKWRTGADLNFMFHADVEVDGQRWPTFEREIADDARYDTDYEQGDVLGELVSRQFFCWRASVLDDLCRLAEDIARKYNFWTVPEAATFIVADYIPPVSTIEASVQSGSGPRNTITLKVRPYVAPAKVADIYRQLQRGFGLKPRRPLSERNLRIVRFVFEERNRQSGKHLTTRYLMDLWNERHPEKPYGSNRIFWRDFKSAERAIEAERIGFIGGWRFRPERMEGASDNG